MPRSSEPFIPTPENPARTVEQIDACENGVFLRASGGYVCKDHGGFRLLVAYDPDELYTVLSDGITDRLVPGSELDRVTAELDDALDLAQRYDELLCNADFCNDQLDSEAENLLSELQALRAKRQKPKEGASDAS